MQTYYLTLKVEPTLRNPQHKDVVEALATCWVREDDPRSAYAKAAFNVRRYLWEILKVEHEPRVVTLADFEGRDIETEHFLNAQKFGISTVYLARSRDGRTSFDPIQLSCPNMIDLEKCLCKIQNTKRKGRCLHFDAGTRCAKIVDAHSIQRNGALSLISDNGKVMAPSLNFSHIKRNHGRMSLSLQGIGKVSTFRGFCATHDNDVFSPIDNGPVVPTREQVALYAYRSVCRELFLKECSVAVYSEQSKQLPPDSVEHQLFDGMRRSTERSLKCLQHHKQIFDACLNTRFFSDMCYVLFCTDQKPTIVFSGVIYPDFDFLGRQLQDLIDDSKPWDLLAFSFVPLEKGWGFLLAWQSNSAGVCVPFLQSLAERIREKGHVGELLFRFVIAGCENMAANPTWWNSLSREQRTAIEETATHGADVLKMPRADYLAAGLENIVAWSFGEVISQMEPET